MRQTLRELGENLWPGNVPADTAARSIAVGVLLGLMPILGLPTPLCALAAGLFQLNLPLVQAANYFVYPLQIALVIPFYRLGEWMYLSARASTPTMLGTACHALTAWLCVSGPCAILLYIVVRRLLHLGSAGLLARRPPALGA